MRIFLLSTAKKSNSLKMDFRCFRKKFQVHDLFKLVLASTAHFASDYIGEYLSFSKVISEEGLKFFPHYQY